MKSQPNSPFSGPSRSRKIRVVKTAESDELLSRQKDFNIFASATGSGTWQINGGAELLALALAAAVVG